MFDWTYWVYSKSWYFLITADLAEIQLQRIVYNLLHFICYCCRVLSSLVTDSQFFQWIFFCFFLKLYTMSVVHVYIYLVMHFGFSCITKCRQSWLFYSVTMGHVVENNKSNHACRAHLKQGLCSAFSKIGGGDFRYHRFEAMHCYWWFYVNSTVCRLALCKFMIFL